MNRLEELLGEISRNKIFPLYFFYGAEISLIDSAIDSLKNKFLSKETVQQNYYTISASTTNASDIISIAQTMPLLASKQLILVKDADDLSEDDHKMFLPYLDSPSPFTCLILCGEKADLRKKFFIAFRKNGKLIEFTKLYERDLERLIRKRISKEGKEIDDDALNVLIELAGSSLLELQNELDKIMLYVGSKKAIEIEDVEAITSPVRMITVFEFIDALSTGDRETSLQTLLKLFDSGAEPLKILALIARQIRLIWKVKELLGTGASPDIMGSQLKLKPFIVNKLISQARMLSLERLMQALKNCSKLDVVLKSSRVPHRFLMEEFVLDFCSN